MKPKFNFKLAGGLLILSLLATVIFRTAKEFSLSAYVAVIAIYSVLTLAAAIWYISLNRGLINYRLTADMLPKEWSDEKKKAFMADHAVRKEKSKKALIILVPMIAAFFVEVIDIYFIKGILQNIIK